LSVHEIVKEKDIVRLGFDVDNQKKQDVYLAMTELENLIYLMGYKCLKFGQLEKTKLI